MTVSLTTELDAERVDKASPERSDSSKGWAWENVIASTERKKFRGFAAAIQVRPR